MGGSLNRYHRYRDAYVEDGVVMMPGALAEKDVVAIEAAYEWMLAHPTPATQRFYPDEPATFLQAAGYSVQVPEFVKMLRDTAVADIAAGLFGGGKVWYLGEQLFLKEGGAARRTPWHQDSSYLAFEGEKLAVVWINLDPLPRDACLEVIRKSHRGITYNGSMFHPSDDTIPLYASSALPRLPDIESERTQWDIVSWPIERGDVLVFHTACLHGGGATWPGLRRRTLSLRFFGDDVKWVERPQRSAAAFNATTEAKAPPPPPSRFANMQVGKPLFETAGFSCIRPWEGDTT
jgi:hypothetical protein